MTNFTFIANAVVTTKDAVKQMADVKKAVEARHPTHPVALTREHWIANNVYRWMPSVDVIHVNPGIFAFMYFFGLPAATHFGRGDRVPRPRTCDS